jgi:hypothetical protein
MRTRLTTFYFYFIYTGLWADMLGLREADGSRLEVFWVFDA